MKKAFFFLSLFAGVGLTSCDSWKEGWTEEYRMEFKRSCLDGDGRASANPEAYCDCVLEKTEKRYPTLAAFMEQKDTEAYQAELKECK
jgi:hypothetical protein